MEIRPQRKKILVGETFVFPFCSLRRFMVMPADGTQEDYEYDVNLYGEVERHKGYGFGLDGGHQPMYSCPENGVSETISITSVTGTLLIYYFN